MFHFLLFRPLFLSFCLHLSFFSLCSFSKEMKKKKLSNQKKMLFANVQTFIIISSLMSLNCMRTIITVWNAVRHSFFFEFLFRRKILNSLFVLILDCSLRVHRFLSFTGCRSCGNCFKNDNIFFFHFTNWYIKRASKRAHFNEKREQENENYLVKWLEQSTTSIKQRAREGEREKEEEKNMPKYNVSDYDRNTNTKYNKKKQPEKICFD